METLEANPRLERVETTPMKWGERVLRKVGGYALGFSGASLEAGGLFAVNPIIAGIGAGLVYAGHRVIEPSNDVTYGAHDQEKPKWKRAARFNLSLLPTFLGAGLIGAGLLGSGEVEGRAINIAQRAVIAGIGIPVLVAGVLYERHLHRGGEVLPGLTAEESASTAETPTSQNTTQENSSIWDKFKRSLKEGFEAGRQRAQNPRQTA